MLTLCLALLTATPAPLRPQVTVIEATGGRPALLLSFDMRASEPAQVASQAARALLKANAALPATLEREVFAVNGLLRGTSSGHGLDFLLVAPASVFPSLAARLLTALLRPRLDARRFARLSGEEAPVAEHASSHEELLVALDPVLTGRAPRPARELPQWESLVRLQLFLGEYVVPANASVALMGAGTQGLEAALALSGGGRTTLPTSEGLLNVNETLRARHSVHIVGMRVPRSLKAPELAAMRVARLLLHQKLTDALRSTGMAYTVEVAFCVVPAFRGLLVVVPAWDDSGLDFSPTVASTLSDLTHGASTEADFERARTAVLRTTHLWQADPAAFLELVRQQHAELSWVTPEGLAALEGLDLATFKATTNRWLVDYRKRFYVKLSPQGPLR